MANRSLEDFKKNWEEQITKLEKQALSDESVSMIYLNFDRDRLKFKGGLSEKEFSRDTMLELDTLKSKLTIALETANSRFKLENRGISKGFHPKLYLQPKENQHNQVDSRLVANTGDNRKVFVVHGRNQKVKEALFSFLRSIDLRPLEWQEIITSTKKGSPYVGEILDTAFSQAQAVVVLMTPDDEGRLKDKFWKSDEPEFETNLTPQARLNVIFEAGIAMGYCPERTIIVEVGSCRPFSDIGGRYVVKMDNSTEKRQDLAKRLETAGCPVNLDGSDWHTAGNFALDNGKMGDGEGRDYLKI